MFRRQGLEESEDVGNNLRVEHAQGGHVAARMAIEDLVQRLQLINPQVKVVGMSGQLTMGSPNVKEMAMRNGFSFFLEKPVSATDLVNKFGELV